MDCPNCGKIAATVIKTKKLVDSLHINGKGYLTDKDTSHEEINILEAFCCNAHRWNIVMEKTDENGKTYYSKE